MQYFRRLNDSGFHGFTGKSLRADLEFDSLELAVLTVKIEAEFGVDVFADVVVTTVGEIEEKIRRHQSRVQATNAGGDDRAPAPKVDEPGEREHRSE